jgi:hypothetical protein
VGTDLEINSAKKPRWWLSKTFGSVLLGCLFGVSQFLNFTGFCYGAGRYYSDEELIDIAINYNLARIDSINGPLNYKKPHVYRSTREVIEQNPNCCLIYRWGGGDPAADGIWARIVGFYVVVADIWFKANDATSDDNYNYYNSLVSMNACGKILEERSITEPSARIVSHSGIGLRE